MAVFVGGIVAAVLGVILLLIWWVPFLQLMAGALPVMLLFGGVIAAYLGFDEVKEKLPYFSKKEEGFPSTLDTDEAPQYKEEADKYKAEVEQLKSELDKRISELEDELRQQTDRHRQGMAKLSEDLQEAEKTLLLAMAAAEGLVVTFTPRIGFAAVVQQLVFKQGHDSAVELFDR